MISSSVFSSLSSTKIKVFRTGNGVLPHFWSLRVANGRLLTVAFWMSRRNSPTARSPFMRTSFGMGCRPGAEMEKATEFVLVSWATKIAHAAWTRLATGICVSPLLGNENFGSTHNVDCLTLDCVGVDVCSKGNTVASSMSLSS